jgi:6-phosphogluconate dehydrogenase
MEEYTEGLSILRSANVGKQEKKRSRCGNYDIARPRALSVRNGSAGHRGGLASWKCDRLVAAGSNSRCTRSGSESFAVCGRVSGSGEGHWTIKAAIDEAVPAPLLTTALYERFSSRGAMRSLANKLLSAMRYQFGGHLDGSYSNSKVA